LHHAFIKRTQLILTVETGVIGHVKRRYLQTGFSAASSDENPKSALGQAWLQEIKDDVRASRLRTLKRLASN
jgi:hypothetical protein